VPFTDIDVKEVTLELPHVRLAAQSVGDSSLPSLLLLHGWLDNSASFELLFPYLRQYHLLAIDWPGHGLSQHRAFSNRVHFLDQVDDLVNLMLELSKKPLAVVGHSMGGAVASLAAGAFPELFNKLIFLDMLGPLSAEPNESVDMLRRSIKLSRKEFQRGTRYFDNLEQALKRRAMVSTLDEYLLLPIVKRNLQQIESGLCWTTDPRLKLPSSYRMTEQQVITILSNIQAKCQLIATEELFTKAPDKMAKRVESIKKLQVVRIQADHHLHIEKPQLVAEKMVDFLTD